MVNEFNFFLQSNFLFSSYYLWSFGIKLVASANFIHFSFRPASYEAGLSLFHRNIFQSSCNMILGFIELYS